MKWVMMLLLVLCSINVAFAHGEGKPGPHDGFIRMPGAFHVEVVPKKNGFIVFLLDMKFQHPTVKNSALKATIVNGKDSYELICKAQTESFFCPAPANKMQSGQLNILSARMKSMGKTVSYQLPLYWPDSHYSRP